MPGKYTVKEQDEAVAVTFRNDEIHITLRSGQVLSKPISFFAWLERATPEQREKYRISPQVIDWPDLDEGIDMYALVNDSWAPTRDEVRVD